MDALITGQLPNLPKIKSVKWTAQIVLFNYCYIKKYKQYQLSKIAYKNCLLLYLAQFQMEPKSTQ